jgi:hypothetical protein
MIFNGLNLLACLIGLAIILLTIYGSPSERDR